MGKYIKFVIGLMLVFSSIVGGHNILTGGMQEIGRKIVENGVDTTGYVEKRVKHTVGVKAGRIPGMGAYYMLHYNFTTKDGVKYGDSIKVTKDQAYGIQDGQELTIRYMNGQPTINSVLGIETYMTAEEAEEVPWGAVIPAILGMLLGGLWLAWSGGRAIGIKMPSFARKDDYQLDRAALLREDRGPGSSRNGQPMFGGKR
jgi:hypothetical protein